MLLLYAYLVDSLVPIVLIKNKINIIIMVLRNYRLDTIYNTNFNNYYLISQEDQANIISLVTQIPSSKYYSSQFKCILKILKPTIVTILATYSIFSITETMVLLKPKDVIVSTTLNNIIILNSIIIFRNTSSLQLAINRFPSLQEEDKFTKIL